MQYYLIEGKDTKNLVLYCAKGKHTLRLLRILYKRSGYNDWLRYSPEILKKNVKDLIKMKTRNIEEILTFVALEAL